MINLQARPLNSASRLAVLIEVDFCPPYSANVLDMLRFSAMSSTSSSSRDVRAHCCNIQVVN
ncbi:hypothetical protein BD769DRAFT_1457305, partial [Suillus cothurnatus]